MVSDYFLAQNTVGLEDYVLQQLPLDYLNFMKERLDADANKDVKRLVGPSIERMGDPEGIRIYTKDEPDRTLVRIMFPVAPQTEIISHFWERDELSSEETSGFEQGIGHISFHYFPLGQ